MLRGALAGTAGTWVMDQVTTAMLSKQPSEVTEREEAAAVGGKGAVTNLVERVAGRLGLELSPEQQSVAEQVVHFGLGAVPGALYALLRRRVPLLGLGGGLLFGFLLWAVNDEYLNTRLGLSAPPDAYPPETHWRGLAGHLALGATTNSAIDLLGG